MTPTQLSDLEWRIHHGMDRGPRVLAEVTDAIERELMAEDLDDTRMNEESNGWDRWRE